MKKFIPREYQSHSLEWLIQRTLIDGHGGGAFFLDPGLGKTSTTLAYLRLVRKLGLGGKALIVAPLRVVYSVWPAECAKWTQFASTRYSIVHGTPTQRLAALSKDADIYLVNPEGLPWVEKYLIDREMPFDTLVVDESTKFKTWGAARTKCIRRIAKKFQRRLILTGTPSPNSLEDLFAQMFIVDLGESLGTGITKFRERWFSYDTFRRKHEAKQGASEAIERAIGPACLRLSEKDHLSLPDLIVHDVEIDLPANIQKAYKKLERELFIALADDNTRILPSAAAKYIACRQVANGGLYDDDRNPMFIHNTKIEVIGDLVDELQGKPALIAMQFKHDLIRLKHRFPRIQSIDGTTKGKEAERLVGAWNAGELPYLAVQPKSLSHGVNMQSGPGRDIIWLGLTDSLEDYLQFNKRIHRQGVTDSVRIHRVMARRTVDEPMRDRLENKDRTQAALLDALNKYRKREGV